MSKVAKERSDYVAASLVRNNGYFQFRRLSCLTPTGLTTPTQRSVMTSHSNAGQRLSRQRRSSGTGTECQSAVSTELLLLRICNTVLHVLKPTSFIFHLISMWILKLEVHLGWPPYELMFCDHRQTTVCNTYFEKSSACRTDP